MPGRRGRARPRFVLTESLRRHATLLTLALALAALAGCTAKIGSAASLDVRVLVVPGQAEVQPKKPVQFTAEVSGAKVPGVQWELVEASGGSIDANGLYTAPAAEGTYHVRAVSKDPAAAEDEATVKVAATATPVTVTVTPATPSVYACKAVTLSARVTGAADLVVNWAVEGGAANGTITAGGVYTAPANAGTYHVVAASRFSPSSTTRVPVVVSDHIEGVRVNPPYAVVTPDGTVQFTAEVTTSCGTVQTVVQQPPQSAQ